MSAGIIDVRMRGSVGAFRLEAAFSVPARGVTGLFGPSGCGKTTILRCIAGLHRMEDGFCTVDGDVWQDTTRFRAPHHRPIGYVFQEASLFAHLTVRRNLLFAAPGKVPPGGMAAVGFDEVLDLLGLGRLLDRSPENLSGGERQRVAIGRALLSQPKLLLMDEPLSALDRGTKDEIMPFLERLHQRLSLPMIYVTHDLGEIERLADHLVLLQAGHVLSVGPLSVLQSDPALPLAAGRDAAVSIEAQVTGYDGGDGLLSLSFDGGSVQIPAPLLEVGVQRRLRIAAGDVSLAREPQESTILNTVAVRILSQTSLGNAEILAVLGTGGDDRTRLLARITRRSWERLGLAPGQLVYAQIKSVSLAAK